MSQVPLPAAINLSYWLYKVHPEIFRALLSRAQSKPTLGSLGQDGGDGTDTTDFFPGISPMPSDTTTTIAPDFTGGDVPLDVSTLSTSDIANAISPDLLSLPPPQLDTVSFDVNSMPTPDLVSAADVAAATPVITPSTASTIGAVAGVLTAGISGLAAITTAMYKAGTPQAATIGTQASRAASGSNPVPITYGYNSAGQLVPILQNPATGSTPLSPSTLASFANPSTWSAYAIPIGIGVAILALLMAGSKKR